MDEKQFNALVEKLGNEAKGEITRLFSDAKNGYITSEQFKAEAANFAEKSDIKKLSDAIEASTLEMKKLREGRKDQKTFRQILEDNVENLKKLQSRELKSLNLDLKADVLRSSITSDTMSFRLPDVGQSAFRRVTIPQIVRSVTVGPNNHGVIRYFDQSTVTRNAAARAEIVAAPESALAWTEYNLALEKLLDSIPVSHEAMTDVDFIEGEIRRFLDVNMMLKEEQQLFSGTGVAPEWEGLYSVYATDYTQAIAAADKAANGGVVDASIADLIMFVATKITNGFSGKFMPNFVLLNPADALKLKLKKDVNNNYIIPPFMSADGKQINGMTVVESSLVTANTLLVGDGNWATYYQQEGFSLELGWVTTQFTSDMMTLKARKRGNLLVRSVDQTAFYKVTDIATRLTDITA